MIAPQKVHWRLILDGYRHFAYVCQMEDIVISRIYASDHHQHIDCVWPNAQQIAAGRKPIEIDFDNKGCYIREKQSYDYFTRLSKSDTGYAVLGDFAKR